MNIIDRLMGRFGYVKHQPRRSYAAAKINRLTQGWASPVTTADAELRPTLRTLRARSRELSRNNDYAKKFLRMCKVNVVGPKGIRLQNKAKDPDGRLDKRANDMIEEAWDQWSRKGNCTVCGKMSWLDAQNLFIETIARDGEVLVRKVRGFDNKHRFAVQFVEADHLDEGHNIFLDGGNEIRMGVEVNSWDRPVAYHFLAAHPGDYAFGSARSLGRNYVRFPASEIIHSYLVERSKQTRGVPWMHTAMTRMNMVGEYEEAELVAARVGASKMGFYERDAMSAGMIPFDAKDQKGNLLTEVEPGMLEELPPGYKFTPFTPDHPSGNYGMFVKATLRGIASGLGVSYNSLACDLEGVNYSSIRSGVIEERDVWRQLQSWMIESLHADVFSAWLEMALLTQSVPLPYAKYDKFNSARWRPRGWQWVDPEKDINASITAVDKGLGTRSSVVAEQGEDLEDVFEQLAEERRLAAQYGLKFETQQKPAEPKKKKDSGEEDAKDTEE